MAKENRGLPASFKIDIPDRPKPVDLGDYLDEVEAAPVARPAPRRSSPSPAPLPAPTRPSENIVEFPKQAATVQEELEGPPAPKTEDEDKEIGKPKRRKRRVPKAPPRKQINTTPETQRMIEEIIDYVQSYGAQRDAKASEIFHALILALHESLEVLDLSGVPARGRWGTPTALAFPISLKSAFKAAIAESHNRNSR